MNLSLESQDPQTRATLLTISIYITFTLNKLEENTKKDNVHFNLTSFSRFFLNKIFNAFKQTGREELKLFVKMSKHHKM